MIKAKYFIMVLCLMLSGSASRITIAVEPIKSSSVTSFPSNLLNKMNEKNENISNAFG